MDPQGLIKKIGNVAKRLNTSNRTIYKRITVREGGDDLIGRPGTVTYNDTVLDPQPLLSNVSTSIFRSQDVGPSYSSLLFTGDATNLLNTYLLQITTDAMTRQDISAPDLAFVLKEDSTQKEEVYDLVSYYPITVGGTDVLIYALIRSKDRPKKT